MIEDDDHVAPPNPLSVIRGDQLQDLWSIGFTIIPRASSDRIFDVANGLAPRGMAYEWHVNPKVKGWECVPASRHPGLFAPYGYEDVITAHGLYLVERPKAEVDAFHDDAHAKAHAHVDNWFQRQAASGFTGGVTVLSEGSGGECARTSDIREIGDKTIEDATPIPRELMPYINFIFQERDVLWSQSEKWWDKTTPEYQRYTEIAERHPQWTRGQIMNAVLTPIAIENIRKRRASEGAQHDQSTESSTRGDPAGTVAAPQAGPSEG